MERNPNQDFASPLGAGASPALLREFLLWVERQLRAAMEQAICRRRQSISPEELEDLLQGTLLQVWQLLIQGKLVESNDVYTWVWTIADHLAIDFLRRRKARARAEGAVAASHAEAVKGDAAAEIRDQAGRAAVERQVNERIAGLPSDKQRLLKMHFWEGKKYREIAEILGLPIGTVASRLSRIISILRKQLRIAPEDRW